MNCVGLCTGEVPSRLSSMSKNVIVEVIRKCRMDLQATLARSSGLSSSVILSTINTVFLFYHRTLNVLKTAIILL